MAFFYKAGEIAVKILEILMYMKEEIVESQIKIQIN